MMSGLVSPKIGANRSIDFDNTGLLVRKRQSRNFRCIYSIRQQDYMDYREQLAAI